PGARRPDLDEDGAGPVAGQLGAEAGAGLDQQRMVVERAGAGAAGPAPGVDEPGVVGPEVAPAEAPGLDQVLGPVDEGDVGGGQGGPDLGRVVGGDDPLVAVPDPAPGQVVVDPGRGPGAGPAGEPGHLGAQLDQQHAG